MIPDREWIRANPGRRYRLRASMPGESGYHGGPYGGLNLHAATLLTVSVSGRGYCRQNLLVAGPIIDTDEAAQHALREYNNFIYPSLLTRARYRAWSAARIEESP